MSVNSQLINALDLDCINIDIPVHRPLIRLDIFTDQESNISRIKSKSESTITDRSKRYIVTKQDSTQLLFESEPNLNIDDMTDAFESITTYLEKLSRYIYSLMSLLSSLHNFNQTHTSNETIDLSIKIELSEYKDDKEE